MAIKRPRAKVPSKAAKGDIVNIKTLVGHPMETGRRKDKGGNVIPKNIINKFKVDFNGKEVFSADIRTGIAANPFFEFPFKATESGEFVFTWTEDTGETATAKKKMEVA